MPKCQQENIVKVVALFVAATLVSCESPRQTQEPTSDSTAEIVSFVDEPIPSDAIDIYLSAERLERSASALVAKLDSQLASQKPIPGTDLPSIPEESENLDAIDLALNSRLRALYEDLGSGDEQRLGPLLLRVTLLHWHATLRRRAMQPYHTSVHGLSAAENCAGAVVGDAIFLDYFDALFSNEANRQREAQIVLALSSLARQSACLGETQSARLSKDLVDAWSDIRIFLAAHRLDRIIPLAAQALSSPFLIFHDVEKWRGDDDPLWGWMVEVRPWLLEGVENRRLPASWHGLWLYDRRSGRMAGYQNVTKATDENGVQLHTFINSVATLETIGYGDCSFGEMIERGPTMLGYLCHASVCESSAGPRPIQVGSRFGFSNSALASDAVSSDMVKSTTCSIGASDGRPEGGGRTGGGSCSVASDAGGTRESDIVACLSTQVMQPGEREMRCVAEASGFCATPVDNATKQLLETTMVGIPVAPGCSLSQGGGDNRWDKLDWAKFFARDGMRMTDHAEKAEAARQSMLDFQDKQAAAEAEAAAAKKELKEKELANQTNPSPENAAAVKEAKDKLDKANSSAIMSAVNAAAQAAIMKAEQKKQDEEEWKKLVESEAKNKEEAKNKVEGEKGGNKKCSPDSDTCNDKCNAMARAVEKTMACFAEKPTGTGTSTSAHARGMNPLVVDPIDPAGPTSSAMNQCFGPMDSEAPIVSRLCWNVDCGSRSSTVLQVGDICGCAGPEATGGSGSRLPGTCSQILCSEDSSPVVRNNNCVCVARGSTAPPPRPTGGINQETINMPKPQTFSDAVLGIHRESTGTNPNNTPANEGLPR